MPDNDGERMKGTVFNIERYALEDGPGIRTVVFMKGCPLRCDWCANPESQEKSPLIIYFPNKCSMCGRCIEKCPTRAVRYDDKYGIYTDFSKCGLCGECVSICFYGAREVTGKEMSVDEVMSEVLRDRDFYGKSGGGVTFSGGEPLLQAGFLTELIKACRAEHLHTAVETCLFTAEDDSIYALRDADFIYIDIKHSDSMLHKMYTGVGTERIFENISKVDEFNKKITIRVPLIPGVNDSPEVQQKIYSRASKLKNLLWIEVLPYHRLGIMKYKGLGKEYKLQDLQPVKKENLRYLVEIGRNCGVEIRIGAT